MTLRIKHLSVGAPPSSAFSQVEGSSLTISIYADVTFSQLTFATKIFLFFLKGYCPVLARPSRRWCRYHRGGNPVFRPTSRRSHHSGRKRAVACRRHDAGKDAGVGDGSAFQRAFCSSHLDGVRCDGRQLSAYAVSIMAEQRTHIAAQCDSN